MIGTTIAGKRKRRVVSRPSRTGATYQVRYCGEPTLFRARNAATRPKRGERDDVLVAAAAQPREQGEPQHDEHPDASTAVITAAVCGDAEPATWKVRMSWS